MTYCLPLIAYCLFFIFIAWHRFNFALILFFFLLPTYLIRFSIGPFPTTLLEVMLLVITCIVLLKKDTRHKIYPQGIHLRGQTNLKKQISNNRFLFFAITLFLLSATISIFTSSNTIKALGEWKAFYIEPILLFIILISVFKKEKSSILPAGRHGFNLQSSIIFALILSGLATSILAIYQHFTGWMVPWDFWQNNETFRVTGWYGFPNGVGLYLAPIWPLAFYLLKHKTQDTRHKQISKNKSQILKIKNWFLFVSCFLFLLLAPIAIVFAKSTGALVGLAAGIGILLLAYKKTRWITFILTIICLSSILSFSGFSSLRNEVTFQDRSGQIRLSMWSDTLEFLKNNPITGAGLASYEEKIVPYHTTVNGEGIEIFHHPHNIFLTMWVNLGLLGLVGFFLILIWFFKTALLRNMLRNKLTIFLLNSMVIIITMGLVDSPYIKNDLAIFFWLLPALLISNTQSQSV